MAVGFLIITMKYLRQVRNEGKVAYFSSLLGRFTVQDQVVPTGVLMTRVAAVESSKSKFDSKSENKENNTQTQLRLSSTTLSQESPSEGFPPLTWGPTIGPLSNLIGLCFRPLSVIYLWLWSPTVCTGLEANSCSVPIKCPVCQWGAVGSSLLCHSPLGLTKSQDPRTPRRCSSPVYKTE